MDGGSAPAREKEAHRAPRSRGHIEIDIDVCIFCGACNACVEVCPVKCLSMDNRYAAGEGDGLLSCRLLGNCCQSMLE